MQYSAFDRPYYMDYYLQTIDDQIYTNYSIFDDVEEKYCDQNLLQSQIKSYEEIKQDLHREIDQYNKYQQHLYEDQQYESYYQYQKYPDSMLFNYMTEEDDQQKYYQEEQIQQQEKLQHYNAQQLFLRIYTKTVKKNKQDNIKKEIKQKNQKAQEFMNKFIDKKQKYIQPKEIPLIKQQKDYRQQFIQNANLIFGCDLKQSKEPYNPDYQPFKEEYDIIQQDNQQISQENPIYKLLPFIQQTYKTIDYNQSILEEAKDSIIFIQRSRQQLTQNYIKAAQDLSSSQRQLKIKHQEIKLKEKEINENNKNITNMKNKSAQLNKLQQIQKGEQQQQLIQKQQIQKRIQEEYKDLTKQLKQKKDQNTTIQKYINDTLNKDEIQLKKQYNEAQKQIQTYQKKCSIQENTIIGIEDHKTQIIQKILKQQNDLDQYKQQSSQILNDFQIENKKLQEELIQQQNRIIAGFTNITRKYEDICKIKEEIEKIKQQK